MIPTPDIILNASISWWGVGTTLHALTVILVFIDRLRLRREPSSALLWVMVVWTFPVLGALLYLGFGVDRIDNQGFIKERMDRQLLAERQSREEETLPLAYWKAVHDSVDAEPESPVAREIHRSMNAILPDHPLLGGNQIEILVNGDEAFPRMAEAIRNARHHIHLQTFIFGNDAVGRQFLELLAAKAREGVQVRLLYDRFGSTPAILSALFRRYRNVPNMQINGWTQANPLRRQLQINLRNHRKITVIDGKTAFCGGMNLQEKHTTTPKHASIRDYAFLMKGPVVQELQYSFMRDWYFMTRENPEKLLNEEFFPKISARGDAKIRLLNSGPPAAERTIIADSLFSALVSARRQILLVTPYFVPGRDIVNAMRAAAMRGIDVRLVLPRDNNHVYAGWAARALYEDLLNAGVRVFERRPPFMHAKAALVDDTLAIIGTANLDVRSLYLNYETSLAVFDPDFANRLKQVVLEDIAASEEVNLQVWRQRPHSRQTLENLAFFMTPVL